MSVLLAPGIDLATTGGKVVAGAGGLTVLVAGRWLLRAQALASFARIGGMFLILVGIAALAGVIEINGRHALDLGGMAWRLVRAVIP